MTDHDDLLDQLRRRVDHVHTHTPQSAAPPPGIWSQVLASTQPQTEAKEQPVIDLQPALATPVGAIHQPHTISRFVNVAASLLVVAAIAFAGWFSVMNLRPGGEMDPRYAALGILQNTAGNGVCDVEPLTIDQAVRIVQDPVAFMYSETDEAPPDNLDSNWLGAPPKDWDTLMALADHAAIPVSDDEFFAVTAFVNEYRDCLVAGTKGQIWAMTDPIVVQYEIATRIPLLQPVDATEAAIAELLARQNKPSSAPSYLTWRANPDRKLTQRVDVGMTFSSSSSYVIPFQILSSDEEIGASYDIFGNLLSEGSVAEAAPGNIVVIRSRASQTLYVVGAFESSTYADAPAN